MAENNLVRPGQKPRVADFTLLAPPAVLNGLVETPCVTCLPGGDYILPANLHPLLMVILKGSVVARGQETCQALPRASLHGLNRSGVPAWATPGTTLWTVSIRAERLPELFGIAASALANTYYALDAICEGEARLALRDCLEKIEEHPENTDRQVVHLSAFLDLLAMSALSRKHRLRSMLASVPLELNPSPAEQARQHGLSLRQFERRFSACYGLSFLKYRQQMRFGRALMTFISGGYLLSSWTNLAQDLGYYDQPHFNRDLLQFTGHTPSALAQGIAERDPAFWPYLITLEQMQLLFGRKGY